MKTPRIIRNDFEVYPQKFGNDYTLEIDVEHEGIESHYQNCLSLDYEELKRFYDYITQQRLSPEANASTLPDGNVR